MDANDLLRELTAMVDAATPLDNSAPLKPVLDAGHTVIANWPTIAKALEIKAMLDRLAK